jgi:hypothetical protein
MPKFLAVITTHRTGFQDAVLFVLPDSSVVAMGNLEKEMEYLL